MINLIKKDMRVNFSNKVTNIMLIMYFPIILFLIGAESINLLFVFSTFSFAFIMTKINFVYETKDRFHIFIQSLPIRKRDIVIGKYLAVFINFAIGIVYTLLYIWIFSVIGLMNLEGIKISTVLSTLGLTMLALSISMPLQFRFTSQIANFLNMFLYMIMITFITLDGDIILKLLNFDIYKLGNILGLLFLIIAVYLISIKISIWLYETRKFY